MSDLELAFALADAADAISMRHAAGPVRFAAKADGSPVTDADREVEERLRELVAARRPGEGFLGEEVGASGEASPRWIVDGIDDTVSFAAGGRNWATLVAHERDGEVVTGVVTAPAVGRRWWATRGEGAWTGPIGAGVAQRRLRTADAASLGTARTVVLPAVEHNVDWQASVAARAVELCAHEPRPGGHGPLLVAEGAADLSVHLWGGAWDHAAFVVLVEEAGGRFADLWGGRRLDTFSGVFGTRELVPQLLDALADVCPPRS